MLKHQILKMCSKRANLRTNMNTEDIIASLQEDRMAVTIKEAQQISDILYIVKEDGTSPATFRKLLILLQRKD